MSLLAGVVGGLEQHIKVSNLCYQYYYYYYYYYYFWDERCRSWLRQFINTREGSVFDSR
jgi:hypothetical protein